jgi:hypothetical protein
MSSFHERPSFSPRQGGLQFVQRLVLGWMDGWIRFELVGHHLLPNMLLAGGYTTSYVSVTVRCLPTLCASFRVHTVGCSNGEPLHSREYL